MGATIAHQRVGDQHEAGVEHEVQHAHVVGGPRHDVADALAAVEGLALAQQAGVELIAGIPLHPLRHELRRVVPREPGEPLAGGQRHHDEGQLQQIAGLPARRGHQVERLAGEQLDAAVTGVVQNRGRNHDRGKAGIAHGM